MIGAVTTITCKRCGFSFETEATTNTRCRRCKTVVRVSVAARNPNGPGCASSTRERTLGVVLFSCGHPAVVVVHPGRSIAATLKRYDWECPDTGITVTPTRVLAVLSEAEYENLGQEAFDLLVSRGAAS
jgi:DNA-directed RNA polymerase subunit RPC12/RpoP